jgi:integrase
VSTPTSERAPLTKRIDGYSTRLRYGKDERASFVIKGARDEEEAQARADEMQEMARRLTDAGHSADAHPILKHMGEADSAHEQGRVRKLVEALCTGTLPSVGSPKLEGASLTFKMVGERWTSGWFHREFPDQVELIIQECNIQRLDKAVYPMIGDKPIRLVTRADCDGVMRKLPEGLARGTRRQYAGLMNRILNLAELAGYIERNPLPRGWLPKPGPKKRFPILFVDEDTRLLACTVVPFTFRLLYGFLHREGMRRSEAAGLQWKDLDFDNETISLDDNKTDHARWWKLSPGVAEALRTLRDHRRAKADDKERDDSEDFVFVEENGGALELNHLADRLRVHLATAKLDRSDLTSTGPLKGQFGLHCFRRSFVTRSLALGKNEDFVRQRTGHTSDELLTYRQASKSLAELQHGDLVPLDAALPDLLDPEGWAAGGLSFLRHR